MRMEAESTPCILDRGHKSCRRGSRAATGSTRRQKRAQVRPKVSVGLKVFWAIGKNSVGLIGRWVIVNPTLGSMSQGLPAGEIYCFAEVQAGRSRASSSE